MSAQQDISPFGCVGPESVCPVSQSMYGYRPNLPSTIIFLIIAALAGVINLVLGIKYKTWTYALAMCLASLSMSIGYGGRIMMNHDPFGVIGFQMQICGLTLAPAFNSAAIYLTLKHVVRVFGREYSRIRPKYYTWAFISADIAALSLQGGGGGAAATATDDKSLNLGTNLMMAGIVWQVVTLIIFGITISDFLIRRIRNLNNVPLSDKAQATLADPKFRAFAIATLVTYFVVLIRCVYRIIEMANGWRSTLMQDQVLFICLESVPISIAFICQTVFHPGFCFPAVSASVRKQEKEEKRAILGKEAVSSGSDSSDGEIVVKAPEQV